MYTSSCWNAINRLKIWALCTCSLYVEVYEYRMKLQALSRTANTYICVLYTSVMSNKKLIIFGLQLGSHVCAILSYKMLIWTWNVLFLAFCTRHYVELWKWSYHFHTSFSCRIAKSKLKIIQATVSISSVSVHTSFIFNFVSLWVLHVLCRHEIIIIQE